MMIMFAPKYTKRSNMVRVFKNDFNTVGYLTVCVEIRRVNNGRGTRRVPTNVLKLVSTQGQVLVDKSWEIRAVSKIIEELSEMGWQCAAGLQEEEQTDSVSQAS